MEPIRRTAARYRVYLSVRYEAAADFAREYAENLSRGGLFIRGARSLRRHRDVVVEIELPGYGSYQVRAEVVHVISDEVAAQHGRTAGAGLAIREAPPGFDEALAGYLVRLGRRADALVLAVDGAVVRLLLAAGYQVREVGSPEELGAELAGALEESSGRVAGAVVPQPQLETYRRAARDTASRELLVGIDGPGRIEDVLVHLDRRL